MKEMMTQSFFYTLLTCTYLAKKKNPQVKKGTFEPSPFFLA